MKKFLLLAVAVLTSVFAMAEKIDYTSVTLSATEINLDDEDASIGLIVEGELDEMNQMYAQYGMVANLLNNAYLYEGDDTEGVKLASVRESWGKPIKFIADMSILKYDTSYKLVIKMGGLSTSDYMMNDILENKEEITLSFKTLAGRTDPFIKSAKFNVMNYQTVNLSDTTFTGIKLAVKAMNIPEAIKPVCFYIGGVRLYDLDDPTGAYTFCSVNTAISCDEIILCPKEKLAEGKNYKLVIPFESLYVQNYMDMTAALCYFNEASVEFYTEYPEPTEDINVTFSIGEDAATIVNANADQNFFVDFVTNDYLGSMTAEEYTSKYSLPYANTMNLSKGMVELRYNDYTWGMSGEYTIVVCGAEYDATREACFATTKYASYAITVGEDGKATSIKTLPAASKSANGKFVEGGKVVIIKNGVKYSVAGQIIK